MTYGRMAWAATTVGSTQVGLGGVARPRAELTWRTAMVEATIRQTGAGARRWVKTDAYTRLDPSEKSAVSYFMGMIGARLLTADLLALPHLVHLDAILRIMRKSIRKSRPDFIGYHPGNSTFSMAVEAKGRTHGYDGAAFNTAKSQAGRVPTVVGTTTTITAATMTYFEDDSWCATMADPPRNKASAPDVPANLLVASYYLPIVQALRALPELDGSDDEVVGTFPEAGITVSIPESIFSALERITSRLPSQEAVAVGGEKILSSTRFMTPEGGDDTSGQPEAGAQVTEDSDERSWRGPDLIQVSVSDDWGTIDGDVPLG